MLSDQQKVPSVTSFHRLCLSVDSSNKKQNRQKKNEKKKRPLLKLVGSLVVIFKKMELKWLFKN